MVTMVLMVVVVAMILVVEVIVVVPKRQQIRIKEATGIVAV